MLLIAEADELRGEHPGCGVEKMYYTLCPDFLGRDKFIEIFMGLGYRLKPRRNYTRTTYSLNFRYPNLINGLSVAGPSEVWQSDITYIRVGEKFYYGVFITDVYTRRIVGYEVSDHMRATANVAALKMALASNGPPLVHHSDKGSQYGYGKYLEMLRKVSCSISMCDSAQENAYAERIHLTIKSEYLEGWSPQNLSELRAGVRKAVRHYNNKRKHNALGRLSPAEFERRWAENRLPGSRPVMEIFDYGRNLGQEKNTTAKGRQGPAEPGAQQSPAP